MRVPATHGHERYSWFNRVTVLAWSVVLTLLLSTATASAYWTAPGTGMGQVKVATLGAPTGVTVSSFGADVTVRWSAAAQAYGPVDGFLVTRYAGATPSNACGTVPGSAGTYLAATATSCVDSGVADGTYTYTVTAIYLSWTARSSPSSADSVNGDETKPSQVVSLAAGATNAYLSGTTLYYRPSQAGSFQIADAVTSNASGPASATFPAVTAAGWTHAAQTVSTGSGASPTITYTSGSYSWTATPSTPLSQTVTGRDTAGNTVATTVDFATDATGPTGGVLTVNGAAATSAGSTSYAKAGFFITTRTDYATDVGSGVAGSVLTVAQASLAGNACGTYGTPTTLTGTPTQSGLTTGCYLYTLTGTDNVGNSSSVSTTVRYDTDAPSQVVTLSTAGGAAQTGTVIYFRYTVAGSFTLTDAVTDATTSPATAVFPVISTTGWTHPAQTVSTGCGTAPTISYPSGTYAWAANASAPATHTVVGTDVAGNQIGTGLTFTRDATAPISGKITVNAVSSSTAGTTSFNKTGAFAISLRTDYTDATAGIASSVLTVAMAPLTGNVCGTFGAASVVTGTTAQAGLTTGCYKYALTGTDRVGNSATVLTTVKVDTAAPTGGAVTVNGLAASTVGTLGGPTNSATFPIDSRVDYADAESGLKTSVLTRAAAAYSATNCGTFGTATTLTGTPAQTALTTACYRYTLTGTDNSGNTAAVFTTVRYDVTAPVSGALTVNGVAASAAGSTSTANAASYTIGTRTDYTDSASGIASSTLTRQSAALTGTTCGSFSSPVTLTGNPAQTGLTSGCYLYTLTGLDNAGNTSSISTTVQLGPYVSSLSLQNGTGIAGRIDQGDRLVLTFSEQMDLSSICSLWSGNTTNQSLNADGEVTATLNSGGSGNDSLNVTVNDCTLNLGTFALGSTGYTTATVTYGGTGTARTTIDYAAATNTLTVVLGQVSGTGPATVTSSIVTYATPTAVLNVNQAPAGGTATTANIKQF